jgi:hypothetical protein
MKTSRRMTLATLGFAILCAAHHTLAQEQTPPATQAVRPTPVVNSEQAKVFVFIQRTDRHAKYSTAEVFQDAVKDLMDYFKMKNLAMAVDEFGGRSSAQGTMPLETVFNIARDAKARSLLYVVVDRPATKWIKITAQCFEIGGKQLWQEEVSSGDGLSGAHGFKVATQKLHAALDKRIGQEGLPVLTAVEAAPAKQ